ncbi:ribonuclease Z [Clostridium vincentii]|uniref:Ribonuclease Z n=1 Tax=Clostridium vincentii TaxID=52704 RepID=A0A2T0BBP9_9CLOT|nr:ribonuclease Z [Clostridium vincentii]PRR81326.1 Ribonuclease BN [Clostridium vincentii]
MVDLTLLGCGGGMPIPERFLSSLLINYKGRKILIDCGEGTQVSMKIAKTGFKNIDIICITHIHGDHIIGLPGLLSTIGNSERRQPLKILGPKGITAAVNGLRVVAQYLPYDIEIIEVGENDLELLEGEVLCSTLELDHSSPCVGYRFYFKRNPRFDMDRAKKNDVPKILWNKLQKSKDSINYQGKRYNPLMVMGEERKGIKLSFVTDTRPKDEIVEFIKDSDFFICEGTYGNDLDIEKAIRNKHMTFKESAILAKTGNVKTLLLTHFSPAILEPSEYLTNATDVFNNTLIGEDRMKFTLNFEE